MAAQPHSSFMTVDEYLAFDRAAEFKHEYVDGHVYAMAGGTNAHSLLAARTTGILLSRLTGGTCHVFNSDGRVQVTESRFFYPDVTVSCDARDLGPGDIVCFPRVVLEVLSDSTEAYDRGEKFELYRTCPTLEEYVLISQRKAAIEVYRRAGDAWMLRSFGPHDHVELASLGVRFPVTEVYADLEWGQDVPPGPSATA